MGLVRRRHHPDVPACMGHRSGSLAVPDRQRESPLRDPRQAKVYAIRLYQLPDRYAGRGRTGRQRAGRMDTAQYRHPAARHAGLAHPRVGRLRRLVAHPRQAERTVTGKTCIIFCHSGY